MIEHATIKNFQSLKDVSIDLGSLTVIVGASSSGKSALLRSFKALANNIRGTSFITQGETKAVVAIAGQDWAIALERSESGGSYKTLIEGKSQTYTKLAGSVPGDVSSLLGISDSSLHFASQFDKPYLLDESGQNAARILGDLTKVSLILEAGREANKRRLAISSSLKDKEKDLVSLLNKVQQYKGLNEKITKAKILQEKISSLEELEFNKLKLKSIVSNLDHAFACITNAPIEPPSIKELQELSLKERKLENLLQDIITSAVHLKQKKSEATGAKLQVETLEESLDIALAEAGQCPLCGNEIK